MAELTLPKDFFFGAAMSGPQTEGGWNVGGKLENRGITSSSARRARRGSSPS